MVRRLSFAASTLPKCMPMYWETVGTFATLNRQERNDMTPEEVKVVLENLEIMDGDSFMSDSTLIKELAYFPRLHTDSPLGIVLISDRTRVCCVWVKITYLK